MSQYLKDLELFCVILTKMGLELGESLVKSKAVRGLGSVQELSKQFEALLDIVPDAKGFIRISSNGSLNVYHKGRHLRWGVTSGVRLHSIN